MVSANLGSNVAGTEDRRASLRQISNWEGRCESLNVRTDQSWWFAQVRDLSASGIGLLVRRRYEPGTLLLIEVTSPDHHLMRSLKARVVHATPDGNNWLLGCTFINLLDDAAVQALR